MIEFPITMTSGGSVCLPGHASALALGYAKNKSVYRLAVTATGEWAGLTIRAFWHVPGGSDPASTLVVDGYVAVPASVTAQPGNGCITFEGSDGTRTVTSADLRYRVSANSGTEDGTMPEPGTPAWQELVDAVHTDATAAEQAKTDAQTAAEQAGASAKKAGQSAKQAADSLQKLKDGIANGDFKGEKGDPGPIGPVGPQGEQGPQGPKGETGNPLSVDDAFPAPLCGLTVYGRSTQDGTPMPNAPVPIVSAGDGGSLTVKVTGKNLLNPSLFQNNKYQNFNAETGYYEIDSSNDYWITGIQPCLPSTTYHFNVYTEGGCFYDEKKNVIGIAGFEFTVKTPAKCAYYCVNFSSVRLPYGSPVIATVSEPATYSPYREQLLTLPTPTGLPGIPVTSGGNYTDSTGQQWVCDEVDLERGVKVQRVNAVDLSTCVITGSTNLAATKRLAILLPLKGKDYTVKALCNRLPYFVSFTSDAIHFYVDITNAQVFIPIGAKNPEEGEYILFYVLDAPIETPLTPAEIAAYKALIAYAPDTVVQASDGAGIQLGYQRDVNIAIKRIEDAVASMTTT